MHIQGNGQYLLSYVWFGYLLFWTHITGNFARLCILYKCFNNCKFVLSVMKVVSCLVCFFIWLEGIWKGIIIKFNFVLALHFTWTSMGDGRLFMSWWGGLCSGWDKIKLINIKWVNLLILCNIVLRLFLGHKKYWWKVRFF